MVRLVRRLLYPITAIFIGLSVLGPINEGYQFISLVDDNESLLIKKILDSFEKKDSY